MSGVVLPIWVTGPIGLVLLAMVGLHLLWVAPHVTPPSRRRIRTACGLVLVLAVPLMVIGFSVIVPSRRPQLWVATWLLVSGLVALAVWLALLDMVNTMRLHRVQREKLRAELGAWRRDSLEAQDDERDEGGGAR